MEVWVPSSLRRQSSRACWPAERTRRSGSFCWKVLSRFLHRFVMVT